MNILTKIGLIAAMLASVALFTACGSKEKAEEESAESALVEQTQDLYADEELQETPDLEESEDVADSSYDDGSSYDDTTTSDTTDMADASDVTDTTDTTDYSAPVTDESDLGATSSGLGH